MNSFNAFDVFTEFQNGEINNATYCNHNQNLNQSMNEEIVFHHHSKRNQFLMLSTICYYYYYCTFSFFSNGCFFPSKHIKAIFKVIKIILNINIEGKACSHHNVQFCDTEQKPIRYDLKMAIEKLFLGKKKTCTVVSCKNKYMMK